MSMIQNSFGGPTQRPPQNYMPPMGGMGGYNPAQSGQYPPSLGMGSMASQMPQMGAQNSFGGPSQSPQSMGYPGMPQQGSFQSQNPQYGPSYPGSQSTQTPPTNSPPPNMNPGGVSYAPQAYGTGGMGMGRSAGGSGPPGFDAFQQQQIQRAMQQGGMTAQPNGQPFTFPTGPQKINNASGAPSPFGGQTQSPQNYMPPMESPNMSPGPAQAFGAGNPSSGGGYSGGGNSGSAGGGGGAFNYGGQLQAAASPDQMYGAGAQANAARDAAYQAANTNGRNAAGQAWQQRMSATPQPSTGSPYSGYPGMGSAVGGQIGAMAAQGWQGQQMPNPLGGNQNQMQSNLARLQALASQAG